MKRIITLLTAVALGLGLVVAFNAPAQAVECRTGTWTSSTTMAPNMFWVVSNQAHRVGHHHVSGCGVINYRSFGQRFESMACTNVRLIWWDSRGRWDSTGPWMTACGERGAASTIRMAGGPSLREGREFSFECRDTRPSQVRPDLWCLYRVSY